MLNFDLSHIEPKFQLRQRNKRFKKRRILESLHLAWGRFSWLNVFYTSSRSFFPKRYQSVMLPCISLQVTIMKNIGGSFRYKMAWKNYLLTTTLETHAKISMFRQHNSPTGRTSFRGKENSESNYFWNIPFQILTQSKFFPTRYNAYSDRMGIYNLDKHFISVIHIWESDKINNETF